MWAKCLHKTFSGLSVGKQNPHQQLISTEIQSWKPLVIARSCEVSEESMKGVSIIFIWSLLGGIPLAAGCNLTHFDLSKFTDSDAVSIAL